MTIKIIFTLKKKKRSQKLNKLKDQPPLLPCLRHYNLNPINVMKFIRVFHKHTILIKRVVFKKNSS